MKQLGAARDAGDLVCVGRCVQMLHSLLDQSEVEGVHGLRSHSCVACSFPLLVGGVLCVSAVIRCQ